MSTKEALVWFLGATLLIITIYLTSDVQPVILLYYIAVLMIILTFWLDYILCRLKQVYRKVMSYVSSRTKS